MVPGQDHDVQIFARARDGAVRAAGAIQIPAFPHEMVPKALADHPLDAITANRPTINLARYRHTHPRMRQAIGACQDFEKFIR